MSIKEGKTAEDALASGKPSESSLVDLLHGLQGPDKERGQTSLRMSLYPLLIANILLSVVLLVAIYRIGVQGFGLREKVEDLSQKNTQLAETLKSMEEEVYYSKQEEPESEPSMPEKPASVVKPPTARKRTSAKPSKVSKIIYRAQDGDCLSRVSEKFGVSVEQLQRWNSTARTDRLLVGQALIINKEMTTDDLPYTAHTFDQDGSGEIETDYIEKKEALKQIAEVRAEAKESTEAIAQLHEELDSERKAYQRIVATLESEIHKRQVLEGKLTTDYMSKQEALVQIAEVKADAEVANKAILQLQARLDTDRMKSEQTIAALEAETEEQQPLQEKEAKDGAVGNDDAYTAKPIVRRLASLDRADEYMEAGGEATIIAGDPAGEIIHVIQAKENLSTIGAKYGVSWVTLAKHNDLSNPSGIYVGQKLRIPAVPPKEEHVALPGEELHTVQSGDNLWTIGRTYGVSWRQIAEENGIVKADNVYVGRVLKIPVNHSRQEH